MPERENVEEVAAQWVAREDRDLTADELRVLSNWLDAAPANQIEYLRQKAGWQRTERLAALRGSYVRHVPMLASRYRYAIAAVLLVGLVAVGVKVYLNDRPSLPQTYIAGLAEHPILRLSDGTRIQLNTNTQVKTQVTGAQRTVTLERGEAYFEVVHDDKRPFVVYAGDRRITDLGTKFSVSRQGDDVKVIVTEGRVRVDTLDAPVLVAPVFAGAGNVVLSKADGTLVAAQNEKELDDDLSWRTGVLNFDQATLADAAQQFNRYNARKIIVVGQAREIRIGGSFRADNIEVFAQLVKNALGLKVTQAPDQITISQ
jgi:transmembrane sensor